MSAIILDTETTGIDAPEIVEAAWCRLDGTRDVARDHFVARYKPAKPITLGAMATHHITIEDLADCPPSLSFKLPGGIQYLIGHNVDFDWQAIGSPDVKRICTLALCRKFWPEADSHSQTAMLYLLAIDYARVNARRAHSAADDVLSCEVVLQHILSRLDYPETWEEVWQQSELARIPEVMPFGKHKGVRIEKVPSDYKRWLLNQPDVDKYLRKAISV